MKAKLLGTLRTGKNITICAALVLTLGTTTTLAANAATGGKLGELFKLDNGTASYSTDGGQTWNEGTPTGSDLRYSLDGGQTWNDGLPPAGSDDQSLVAYGTPPAEGDANSLITKNENGVISYSSDGGKTWSSTAPSGFNVTVNPDCSVSVGR
ncbi:BNR/Asp-box repeat protein [Oxobacter pfennigii]|uniref:BNR/Asp-box repeat protein n=1 Tax=Oxobacter pfennigii TaxID=36849 RepID=A0A0P8X4Z8_9CLOT|nr:sialidase family protein [Oxobacter pfennigii]KPU45855.1 BNR/Asp-box repeat protein [Oxobacter pfennigii]